MDRAGRGSATYKLYKDFFIKNGIDIVNNMGIGFVPKKMAEPLLEENRLVQIPVKHANFCNCRFVTFYGRFMRQSPLCLEKSL